MKVEEKLAHSLLTVLKALLKHEGIGYDEDIQHGGGTMNYDAIICGKCYVAMTVAGELEVYHAEDGGPGKSFDILQDPQKLQELLEILRKGSLDLTIAYRGETIRRNE